MPVNKNNGYHTLSKDLSERIEQDRANHWVNPYACPDSAIIRRFDDHDKPHLASCFRYGCRENPAQQLL